jgi:AraC-like DNA-binding protein
MNYSSTFLFLAFGYAAGIAFGIVLAALLLLNQSGNRIANRWLAAAVGSLAVLSLGSLLEDTQLVLRFPHLGYVTDWLIFAVGPCIWLYVQRLTGRATPTGWAVLVHFLPALVLLAMLIPFHLLDVGAKQVALESALRETETSPNWILAVAASQILAYWLAALATLTRYSRGLRDQYSAVERLNFRWLRLMLIVTLVIWILWVIGEVAHVPWARIPNAIAVPLALYLLGFLGLRQPAVFTGQLGAAGETPDGARLVEPPSQIQTEAVAGCAPNADAPRKYRRSGFDAGRAAGLLEKLEALMAAEKPWLENELTLTELATRVGISPHHLSQLLNADLGKTFFDYVNERRVAEVQRCLRDPAYADQPILDIAVASGFNSKASFNAVFKQQTGMTPSAYRAAATVAPSIGLPGSENARDNKVRPNRPDVRSHRRGRTSGNGTVL